MKTRILDISDCSESPLLASSKHRHRHYKRSHTDRYSVPRSELRSRSMPRLTGLTEFYFKGVNPGSNLDYQLSARSLEAATSESANISYQARCAERWWNEFCRWFGSRN